MTAFYKSLDRRGLAFGFADGSVHFATVEFENRIVPMAFLPAGLKKMNDTSYTDGTAIYERVTGGSVPKGHV